jgi:hypothetical protein
VSSFHSWRKIVKSDQDETWPVSWITYCIVRYAEVRFAEHYHSGLAFFTLGLLTLVAHGSWWGALEVESIDVLLDEFRLEESDVCMSGWMMPHCRLGAC